jgi:predicted nucleic acid-binding protein
MSARVLVDTNVLVYAYDRSEPTRQQQALDVLERLALTGAGAITTQVLAEFFVTVTRKLAAPLSVADAYVRVENYLRVWTVYDLSGLVVLEAARGVRDHQLNFWDAQIWAAARLNQLPVVFSEDFNIGATLEGVRFVNPFDPAFQLADWV